MNEFAAGPWNVESAAERSPSLRRTVLRLRELLAAESS